jgi:ABC-type phosphate transport system auxiliary subunit
MDELRTYFGCLCMSFSKPGHMAGPGQAVQDSGEELSGDSGWARAQVNLRQLLVTVDVLERRNAQLEGLQDVAASLQEEVTQLHRRNKELQDDSDRLRERLQQEVHLSTRHVTR